jgi:hypothetical protein
LTAAQQFLEHAAQTNLVSHPRWAIHSY